MSVPPPIRVVTNDPEERSMAALAHASILLNFFLPGLGIVAAGAVWLTQRERSRFGANQGLQAAVYQLILALVPVVFGVAALVMGIGGIIIAGITENIPLGESALLIIVVGILVTAMLWILGLLYALVGAYEAYQGRDFRYWLIGNLVSRT